MPVEIHTPADLKIAHPDYIDWHARIAKAGKHVLRLTSRRDYLIGCYEYVCARVTGTTQHWGELTPDALIASQEKLPGRPADMQKIEKLRRFCDAFAARAFGQGRITDASMEEIYALSREF